MTTTRIAAPYHRPGEGSTDRIAGSPGPDRCPIGPGAAYSLIVYGQWVYTAVMSARDATINIRVDESERELLRRAAEATHTTLSDFVRRSSFLAAESALADRRGIVVSDADWTSYLASLDAPAVVDDKLVRLFAAPDLFE